MTLDHQNKTVAWAQEETVAWTLKGARKDVTCELPNLWLMHTKYNNGGKT